MRDQELELIAALAEGRLDDETEARALIESAPEYREAYEAQKLALEALSGARTAAMSEVERLSLHRDLWTELRKEPATVARPRNPWSLRLAAVAAGLFVMVGLVAVLSQGTADQGESFDEIAAELADSPTTTAQAADGDASEAEDGADEAQTFEDSTGTGDDSAATLEDLSPTYYSGEADRVRAGEFTPSLEAYEARSSDGVDECLDQAGLDEHQAVGILTPPPELSDSGDLRLVVAVPEGSELADSPVAFVELESCQLIYLDD
ncbi:MAG TPA: hypothetical protein VMM14_01425 [Acidimicrobiia bacterium]|nr:hypothetical protein [Acidimicrobiia bacterium]